MFTPVWHLPVGLPTAVFIGLLMNVPFRRGDGEEKMIEPQSTSNLPSSAANAAPSPEGEGFLCEPSPSGEGGRRPDEGNSTAE
ncbi:hypothetical protein [Calycomorphotria hydatis]|uniref:hypothetical protein n=1 Tax=Calycomorphotria hydatis TaxID=2528027 RepID=UPI00119F2212|nr:hypothetical protein [Calycomorphotria hydatis]